MMTDMRNPLTVAFHKAKLRADLLRPDKVDDILDDRHAQLNYVDAVHEHVIAFDVAESEAIRRRRSDFSPEGQQRLARAQHLLRLAADSAATPQERQHAYDRACKELDGLIVLPTTMHASIERRITGEINRYRWWCGARESCQAGGLGNLRTDRPGRLQSFHRRGK